MRVLFFLLALMYLLIPISAQADYSDGLHAYLKGHYEQAFQELSPLARNGNTQAQYLLGSMFVNGDGVQKDLVRAHALLSLAAAQGHEKAALYKEEISWDMSSSQIAESKKLTAKWKSTSDAREKPDPVSQKTIASIQEQLQALGYYSGAIDGLMGSRTKRSIQRYQQAQGLPRNGQPSQALLEQIEETVAEQPSQRLLASLPKGPWTQVLLHDDFTDGDLSSNPPWTIVSGAFHVDSGHFLRTDSPLPEASQASKGKEEENDALKIFGQVVKEFVDTQQTSQEAPSVAKIYTGVDLGPVFALRMQIQLSRKEAGQSFAFGPFTGQSRISGYLLRFAQEDRQSLTLIRVGRSGTSVIDVVRGRHLLQVQKIETITWLCFQDGNMEILINDEALLKTRDTMYDSFNGITFLNSAGTYGISSFTVFGPDDS